MAVFRFSAGTRLRRGKTGNIMSIIPEDKGGCRGMGSEENRCEIAVAGEGAARDLVGGVVGLGAAVQAGQVPGQVVAERVAAGGGSAVSRGVGGRRPYPCRV